MAQRQKIEARSIYDDPNKEHRYTGDAPKGCVFAYRYHDGGWQYKIGQPWPEFTPGQEIEIETINHYVWNGTVESRINEDTIVFRPTCPKVAMPLPPVVAGQPYVLPCMSGDAWSVRPEAGKVLLIGEQCYKVVGKPKSDKRTSGYVYQLSEVSAAEYAKRPGRIAIKDLTDPNETSHFFYGHNEGRVIQIGMEWLHVERVAQQAYGDGEGREIFGYNTFGVGHYVSADKAAKLAAKWDAKEKVRSLEHSLKVANQDLDYGGNPEAVPGLEAELAEARKAAGIGAAR
jgi:hypothetical protein